MVWIRMMRGDELANRGVELRDAREEDDRGATDIAIR
jgi:hypothetical protein